MLQILKADLSNPEHKYVVGYSAPGWEGAMTDPDCCNLEAMPFIALRRFKTLMQAEYYLHIMNGGNLHYTTFVEAFSQIGIEWEPGHVYSVKAGLSELQGL